MLVLCECFLPSVRGGVFVLSFESFFGTRSYFGNVLCRRFVRLLLAFVPFTPVEFVSVDCIIVVFGRPTEFSCYRGGSGGPPECGTVQE